MTCKDCMHLDICFEHCAADTETCERFKNKAYFKKEKHGHWEVCSDEHEICASEFVCSVCKESFVTSEMTDEQFYQMMKYCPECGAKMDGGKTE